MENVQKCGKHTRIRKTYEDMESIRKYEKQTKRWRTDENGEKKIGKADFEHVPGIGRRKH